MMTAQWKFCLIMTTLLSFPTLAQPVRNLDAGSTSPTSRQEIGIPDTGKYQKRESPEQNRPNFRSETKTKSVDENTVSSTISMLPMQERENVIRLAVDNKKSPVFKEGIQQNLSAFLGRNGGDETEETLSESAPILHSKSVDGRRALSPSTSRHLLGELDSFGADYNRFKKELQDKTGISYSLDVSYMGQRAAPNGKITPWQSQYYGTATWDVFQSDTWGSGSFDIAYELVRYWNGSGDDLGNNIGVVNGVNDSLNKENYFYQLSYTQQFAGAMDWLSITLGQFPLYNFDGTSYDSNQQINFINEALSQNASSTYASAGIGGYATIAPNEFWSVSAGMQDATNIDGNRISTSHLDDAKYTTFVSGTINPKTPLGDATLSLLLYHQPSVPEQEGKTNGWSINAQQNIGEKTAIFARVNGVSKGLTGIKQSYVLGGVYNNPLNRNPLDQIGLAGAVNKLDKEVNGPGTRSVENVLEAYWAWGIGSFITITPDIQFYINPGLNTKSNTATVTSLRMTMMF